MSEIKTPVRFGLNRLMDADGRIVCIMRDGVDGMYYPNLDPSMAMRICTALNEHAGLKAQVAALTEANERYRQALEHYADDHRWLREPCNDLLHGHPGHLCSKKLTGYNHTRNNGYDLAREALNCGTMETGRTSDNDTHPAPTK